MRDINTSLQRAWYEALQATGDEYWEDEEGDDRNDNLYGIIGSVTVVDDSATLSVNVQATIQISLYSKNIKYNNREALNAMAGRLFAAVKPLQYSVIDMSAYDIQMTHLTLINDVSQDTGKLGAYDYKTRILIFKQGLFIK